MAAGCRVCAGSGLLWKQLPCPLCEGDRQWLAFSEWPLPDLEGIDDGLVRCFVASSKKRNDRCVAVVTREAEEFNLKHLENVLQITKKMIKPATEFECSRFFGIESPCIPPIGFQPGVEVYLSADLHSSSELRFACEGGHTGVRCTWEALERQYGSDRWIGNFRKGPEPLDCCFWEHMDNDRLSRGVAEHWKATTPSQVREWLSQVHYDRKPAETVLDGLKEVEDDLCSRYFSPVDEVPGDLGSYGGTTERLFNFLKWNVQWTSVRPNFAVAWYTAAGFEEPYEYGLGPKQPFTFPPWLEVLKEHMMATVGPILGLATPPTGCNFNFYKDGSGALAAHSDDEDIFDGMNQPINIVSFSLGQRRTFKLYFRKKERSEKQLASLSYLTMEGWFQKHMKHGLPKEEDLIDPRINITWRWIVPVDQRASATEKKIASATPDPPKAKGKPGKPGKTRR